MQGLDLAPVARRASRPVVRAAPVPVPQRAADLPREAGRGVGPGDDPLRGLWGWFLDWLHIELADIRADCREAEANGTAADVERDYERYRAHLDLMEWAAKEVDRLYLLDRLRVAVDWSWDREPHPPEPDTYEGDHTLMDG